MDDFLKFARELGFPALVAFFVLWRLEKAMKHLHDAVIELTKLLVRHEQSAQEIMGALRELLLQSQKGGRRAR